VAVGAFVDNRYEAQDGSQRSAKELVIRTLTVLDWASDRTPPANAGQAEAA
jgi:hypothetical protein